MRYLLDTNVVFEWVKPSPNAGVVGWLTGVDEDQVFVSVVTFAELRHGIERMGKGARRRRLDTWLTDELPARFEGRVLAVDEEVADRWGRLVAHSYDVGRPVSAMDAFVAATAHCHGLSVVTRNVTDFVPYGVPVVNPWTT